MNIFPVWMMEPFKDETLNEADHSADLARLAIDGTLHGLHNVLRCCRHATCQELLRGEIVEVG